MRKIFTIPFVVFFVLILFTRFYSVTHTARFTEDESGFMVRLHEIYVEKKITLVGQINDQGTKVFSSLTIYMLMPFAMVGKFSPQSVFYGAAFFGVLTGLLMFFLSIKINKNLLLFSGFLILLWFPLVQTGRWAWNPNFIPLWITLGLLCYLRSRQALFFSFLSGIFLGLSVHQHYYAIFGISMFILLVNIESLFNKKIINAFLIDFGAGLMILPFIIFDLRHKPGIFLLGASNQVSRLQSSQIISNLTSYSLKVFEYFVKLKILLIPLIILTTLLILFDLVKRNKSLFFIIPCIFQIIMIAIVAPFFIHYFFVCIVFFFVWLIYPRKSGRIIPVAIISLLILGSIFSIKALLVNAPVKPDLPTITKITDIIVKQTKNEDLKNVNIAVLSSPDENTYGKKYRDLLLVNYNFKPLTSDEYPITDNLFVISTSSYSTLLRDPAYELNSFRKSIVKTSWQVDNWQVYLLNKIQNAQKTNR